MASSAPARQIPSRARPAVRRSLFFLGIGMSILAVLLVVVVGNSLAHPTSVAPTATATVVVAAQNIHRHAIIGTADLTVARLPVAGIPPGAILETSRAMGKVAQIEVLKGQPLTTNVVTTGSSDPAYLPIPIGWVATTLPANEQTEVAGYVSPGDLIDLVASVSEAVFSPTVANPRPLTRTTFTRLRVIQVGGAGTKSTPGQAIPGSVTVLVTPCDAPYLTWLLGNTTLRYDLQSTINPPAAPVGPDPSCPEGSALPRVGPAEVDKRFGFTRA